MDADDHRRSTQIWRDKKAIIGAVVLGVIGNAMWEVLAKPGISRISRFVIYGVTLGSTTVRDMPYSMAGLDPTPLPGMMLTQLLGMLLLVGVAALVLFRTVLPWLDGRSSLDEAMASDDEAAIATARLRERRRRKIITRVSFIYLVGVGIATYVGANMLTQATEIKRIHEANLIILSPHVSPTQLTSWRARFAAQTSKAEFDKLSAEIRNTALQLGVKLRTERIP